MFQRLFSPVLVAVLLLLVTLLLLNNVTLPVAAACESCLVLDQPIDLARIPVAALPKLPSPGVAPMSATGIVIPGLLGPAEVLPNPGDLNESSVIADVDGNGLNDIVVSDGMSLEGDFYIYYQHVTGTLTAPVTVLNEFRTHHFAVADLNNDNRPDLAFDHRVTGIENALIVRLQAPDGSFGDPISYTVPSLIDLQLVVAADFDNDMLTDVAVSTDADGTMVFFQTVSGTLSTPLILTSTLRNLQALMPADVNGDKRTDLIRLTSTRDGNPNQVAVYPQTDSGFAPADYYTLGEMYPWDVAAGDLNDDGLNDLAILGFTPDTPYVNVLYQNISGTFAAPIAYPIFEDGENIAIADINQDGRNDLVMTHRSQRKVSVQYQNEGGGFSLYEVFNAPISGASDSQAISVGDFTGDGLPDVAIADSLVDLVILRHSGLLQHHYMSMIFNEKVNPIYDDFSNPQSGWPIATTSATRYRYLNGTYQIQNLTDSFSALASAGHLRRDYDMTVEVRKVGAAQGGYGLVYGMTDDLSEFYVFLVWPDYHEIWSLHYTAANGFTLLQSGVNDTFVHGGEAWNMLRVVKSNISVSLYVNGHFTSQHPYTQSGWRRLGFFTVPIDAFFDSRYDNYSVELP